MRPLSPGFSDLRPSSSRGDDRPPSNAPTAVAERRECFFRAKGWNGHASKTPVRSSPRIESLAVRNIRRKGIGWGNRRSECACARQLPPARAWPLRSVPRSHWTPTIRCQLSSWRADQHSLRISFTARTQLLLPSLCVMSKAANDLAQREEAALGREDQACHQYRPIGPVQRRVR